MSNISLPPNLATDSALVPVGEVSEKQVTSADILNEANQLKLSTYKRPEQTIQDLEELRSYQLSKRREFEQQLNKNRLNFGQWMRYAKWEVDHNHDFKRARSIMERALEVNVQHVPFWVRYIELELLHHNVNHARNLLDRAVTTLPKVDKLWFMYVQTEEALGNFRGTRSVFERWLTWRPPKVAWTAYVEFEQRYEEWANARNIYLRYVSLFPGDADMWLDWLVFETTQPPLDDVQIARIRGIFECAMDTLIAQEDFQEKTTVASLVARWCLWEASMREFARARAIYTTLLEKDYLSKTQKAEVFQSFSEFEKKYGTSASTSETLLLKRKLQYEQNVDANPKDYESWWELAKLEQDPVKANSILENAVQTSPDAVSKLIVWRRYVFLWIKLALSLEFDCKNLDKARETWKKALDTVPHTKFSFAKLWIHYAEFELRHRGLSAARKVLGRAIGQTSQKSPKRKIFRYYIALEQKLAEWDRVRKLYEKWLELALIADYNQKTTLALPVLEEYVAFEQRMGESERCVALYDMAMSITTSPELELSFLPFQDLLSVYIDYLKEEFMYDKARQVYREVLDTKPSVEVWIAFAIFESSILSPLQMDQLEQIEEDTHFAIGEYQLSQTRKVFGEAYNKYKATGDGENALQLLEAWKSYEEMHGTTQSLADVEKKTPTQIRKRRQVDNVEEIYTEYVFPEIKPNISQFLANAKKWAESE